MGYHRYDLSNVGENQVSRLKSHPLNAKIYGESKPDAGLLKSVAEHGVFNPLIITRDKEILSGTRRWLAAKAAGFTKIPTIVLRSERDNFNLVSELFLIESNKAREKTIEEKGREFTELRRIHSSLAKERMLSGVKPNPMAKRPQGQSGALAAAEVGLGTNKAKKLEAVIGAADKGDAKAKAALKAVNEGEVSVSEAWRQVTPEQKAEKKKVKSEQQKLASELQKLFGKVAEVQCSKEGRFNILFYRLEEKEVRRIAKTI